VIFVHFFTDRAAVSGRESQTHPFFDPLSYRDLAPHLEFVDLGGHGYAKVRLSAEEMRTEFVCIPRPLTRSEKPDGGPLRYRTLHTAALWKPGERPQLRISVVDGDAGLSI
jgi:alkaline phosphatase D